MTGVNAGTATIYYTIGSCASSAIVTINPLPAAVTASGGGAYCSSTTITASNGGDGTIYYQGTTSGGTSSATASGSQTVTASGTYYFRALSSTGCWGPQGSVTVTINPLPNAISGTASECLGSSYTFTDAGGGTWQSSDETIATVGSSSGSVTAMGVGSATITYTLNTGCTRSYAVTVNPISPIAGLNSLCVGTTLNVTDATPGGTWQSSNSARATVNPSGLVSAVAAGGISISYTTSTGCMAIATANVLALPAGISGNTAICQGSAYGFSDVTGGGSWIADGTIAGVGTDGVVTGLSAGTTTISYTATNGCSSIHPVTVNPVAAIGGNAPICLNSSITLTDAVPGGAWLSQLPTTATVSAGGILTGAGVGNTIVTYTTPAGCRTTVPVTVNALPAGITGTASVCIGQTTQLNDATSGGSWSSGSNATVSASGLVTGSLQGTAIVSYILSATGCASAVTVTVNQAPTLISGTVVICAGSTTSLSGDVTGGSWSSSNTSVASVAAATGVVTGMAGGTATITYTMGAGCYTTATITINPILPVTGNLTACVGSTTTLIDASIGGTWSSSDASIAAVDTSGIVTGNVIGTAIITYALPGGCARTAIVTVNAPVIAITGNAPVCPGATITLASATGGTWSSSVPSVASVDPTGVVTGLGTGFSTVTYTAGAGCFTTAIVSVNSTLQMITGSPQVCLNSSITYHNMSGGGSWSSTNLATGTIDPSTGVFTGLATGTTTISYGLPGGCFRTMNVTVVPLPAAITGNTTVCLGSTTLLGDITTPANDWVSSNTGVATVLANGLVTAVTGGSTTITYTTSSTGCSITTTLFVTPLPAPIVGNAGACLGSAALTLSDTGSGTWSTANPAIASIGSTTGVVAANSAGNTTVTYSLAGSGCQATATLTVNPSTPILGPSSICAGTTPTLTNTTPGGTWTSSGSAASIGSSTGIISANTQGTAVISYILPTGCNVGEVVTINPLPDPIAGNMPVCVGSNITLSSSGSGTWSCSNTNASIDGSAGIVTGLAAGTTVVTYTSGCSVTAVLTINATPVISGTPVVCAGSSIILNANISGGTWASVSPSFGTVGSATGIVSGISAGTTTISYSIANGCARGVVVTVNPLPAAISGATTVCTGSEILLTSSGSGTWVSSNPGVGTVDAVGIVGGVSGGGTYIYYALNGTGCSVRSLITVTALPATITAPSAICVGSGVLLSDIITGGTWSTSDVSYASIGSASGILSGVSQGVVTVTYATGASCYATTIVSVSPQPAPITAPSSVCQGGSLTLSDINGGGTWSSTVPSVATVGSGSGIFNAVNTGSTIISYMLPNGCSIATVISVNPVPVSISGSLITCPGATTTLTGSGGGTWSTSLSSAGIGTIDAASGVFTGISAGSATVTYVFGTGCASTVNMVVNPLPAAITGNTTICLGSSTILNDATTPANAWTSGNPAIATVIASGLVSAVSVGSVTITYTANTGCSVTKAVFITPLPGPISGNVSMCMGASSVTLSDTGSGTWTSNNISVATIGSSSGNVHGVSVGNATITYTLAGAGCSTTAIVTVNPPSAIIGTAAVCATATTALSNSTGGGTWTSTGGAATVVSSTGVVSGISAGSSTISYLLPSGCNSGVVVTVSPLPAAIGGNSPVCVGSVRTLTNTGSGTWSSSNTGVATVDASGNVTGVSAGNATITFTSGSGCVATAVLTVNFTPAISGTPFVCAGSSINLNNNSAGGTWSSVNPTAGTVGSASGVVSGITAGSTIISYTIANGCAGTVNVTVSPLPAAISGSLTVCTGATTGLTSSGGGTWSSSNPGGGAVVDASGNVTGVGPSYTFIYYTLSTGCAVRATMTVTPLPSAITGPTAVCAGSGIGLSDATSGGTWSSADAGFVTVGSATGVVNGTSAGTATITYSTGVSCAATSVITINPQPAAITVPTVVCVGSTYTLTDATGTGTWASSVGSVASIGSGSGVLNALNTGSTSIQYILATGCSMTSIVTVNPAPNPISGSAVTCPGSTTALSDAGGGTWSAVGSAAIGTVDAASGIYSGISAGSATVTYTLGTGCARTMGMVVNPLPAAITGNTIVCLGSTTTLNDATTPANAWVSNNTAAATILANGVVTPVGVGTSTITYTAGNGCSITTVLSVTALPAAIAGNAPLCVGASSVSLTDAGSGVWTSSAPAIATVGSLSGNVTGVSAGNATVYYSMAGAGCLRTVTVTVNPLSSITGTPVVCSGSTITLGNTISGGTWASLSPSVAAIGTNTGIVTGGTPGTATVVYTPATGCNSTVVVTVNVLPAAITGNAPICAGLSRTFVNGGSGVWSSSNGNASVVGSTGSVTGVTAGTAMISFTSGLGCSSTTIATINALPVIAGSLNACPGSAITLTGTPSGGAWTSVTPSVGTIGSASGIFTGLVAGSSTVSYTATVTGCVNTVLVTVNALPATLTGTKSLCVGSTTTLSSTSGGGTWSSTNSGGATVNGSGVVYGVAASTVSINYILPTGCGAGAVVTINAAPSVITGSPAVCIGLGTTLADATGGGSWTSGDVTIATVGTGNGYVTGVAQGTTTITYATSPTCFVSTVTTVTPSPTGISASFVCQGISSTLTASPAGGTWLSSITSVATIGSSTGIITGVNSGNTTVTYTLNGCRTTRVVTVNAAPGAITGSNSVCAGGGTGTLNCSSGGAWTSADQTVVTIGSSTGLVTGVGAGTTTCIYTISNGCARGIVVTSKPQPAPITGALFMCAGAANTLHDVTTPANNWTSSNTAVANINAGGVITTTGTGTTTISYTTSANGCSIATVLTVNPAPTAGVISSPATVATSATITATSSGTAGGTWTSSNAHATIGNTTGIITGVSAGTFTVTYTVATCATVTATKTITESGPAPAAHGSTTSGTITLNPGLTVNIANNEVSGGLWSSGDNTIATVDAVSGDVTGVSAGAVLISYTITDTNGEALTSTRSVIVSSLPIDLRVLPNPNHGLFTIKGSTGSQKDEEVTLEIVDMLGQVQYTAQVMAVNGNVNEQVSLNSSLINGMYMLNVKTAVESKSFHFIIAR